jgi:hypothetical protein
MIGVFYQCNIWKSGPRDRSTHRGDNVKTQGEGGHVTGVMHLQAKGQLKILVSIGSDKKTRKDSPLAKSDGAWLCDIFISDFLSLEP